MLSQDQNNVVIPRIDFVERITINRFSLPRLPAGVIQIAVQSTSTSDERNRNLNCMFWPFHENLLHHLNSEDVL